MSPSTTEQRRSAPTPSTTAARQLSPRRLWIPACISSTLSTTATRPSPAAPQPMCKCSSSEVPAQPPSPPLRLVPITARTSRSPRGLQARPPLPLDLSSSSTEALFSTSPNSPQAVPASAPRCCPLALTASPLTTWATRATCPPPRPL